MIKILEPSSDRFKQIGASHYFMYINPAYHQTHEKSLLKAGGFSVHGVFMCVAKLVVNEALPVRYPIGRNNDSRLLVESTVEKEVRCYHALDRKPVRRFMTVNNAPGSHSEFNDEKSMYMWNDSYSVYFTASRMDEVIDLGNSLFRRHRDGRCSYEELLFHLKKHRRNNLKEDT